MSSSEKHLKKISFKKKHPHVLKILKTWKGSSIYIKQKYNKLTDNLIIIFVRFLKFLFNIDITPIFIFGASYMLVIDFPVIYRAVISVSVYVLYNRLVKDIIKIRGRKV